MRYIILKDTIFEIGLKPSEFTVYATLMALKDKHTGKTIASHKAISKFCGLSERTVYGCLISLEDKGVIKSKNRYNLDGNYISKIYSFTKLLGKGFFKVNVNIFKKNLSSSSFMVYCFLCKCADKKKKAVISLNCLKKELKMTVKTVISSIENLVNEFLVLKSNYITKDGRFACNRFFIKDDGVKREDSHYITKKFNIKGVLTMITKHKNNPIDLLSQYLYLKQII